MRIILVFLLCFIIINLFIGLYHIVRGNKGGEGNQVVRSLTIRVAASIVLFAVILVLVYVTSEHLN